MSGRLIFIFLLTLSLHFPIDSHTRPSFCITITVSTLSSIKSNENKRKKEKLWQVQFCLRAIKGEYFVLVEKFCLLSSCIFVCVQNVTVKDHC